MSRYATSRVIWEVTREGELAFGQWHAIHQRTHRHIHRRTRRQARVGSSRARLAGRQQEHRATYDSCSHHRAPSIPPDFNTAIRRSRGSLPSSFRGSTGTISNGRGMNTGSTLRLSCSTMVSALASGATTSAATLRTPLEPLVSGWKDGYYADLYRRQTIEAELEEIA